MITLQQDLSIIKAKLPSTEIEAIAICDAISLRFTALEKEVERLKEYEWMYKDLSK